MGTSVEAGGDSAVVRSRSSSLTGLQATTVTMTKPMNKQDQLVFGMNTPPVFSSHDVQQCKANRCLLAFTKR
jgi:hypothetical protein